MPRICHVCSHPNRDAIDAAIVNQVPTSDISGLHGVSGDSIRRHGRNHLPGRLVRAGEIKAVAAADDLLGQALRLQEEALGVLELAKADGNPGGVLQAIDRLQKGLVLMGSLREAREETVQQVVEFRWGGCPHHPEGCPAES